MTASQLIAIVTDAVSKAALGIAEHEAERDDDPVLDRQHRHSEPQRPETS
jgi:hypothetical protein